MVFLRGSWRVRRTIHDHRAGQDGVFVGTAVFSPGTQAGELSYIEQGELVLGAHRGPAGRSLIYRDLGGSVLDVCFGDGRPFYRLDLREGQWTAEHQCDPDRYRVAGRLVDADTFTERWQVEGPMKQYELDTTYIRMGCS